MFDAKDSFLWFGLFAAFIQIGLEDQQFISFLSAFSLTLCRKKISGNSFEDLCRKATKDRTVVAGKMNHLNRLMREYFT